MALSGYNQNNHNQQIDEYEYDDADEFYDDTINSYGRHNNHEVDDSEGNVNIEAKMSSGNVLVDTHTHKLINIRYFPYIRY